MQSKVPLPFIGCAFVFHPERDSCIGRLWNWNVNMLARLRYATTRGWTVAVNLQGYSSAPALKDVADSWRNPAAVLHGIDDLRFEDLPLPQDVSGQLVRVQMRSVGICGSDVHLLKQVLVSHHLLQQVDDLFLTTLHAVQGRLGHYVLSSPTVVGHECAGYMTLPTGLFPLLCLSLWHHHLCFCNMQQILTAASMLVVSKGHRQIMSV